MTKRERTLAEQIVKSLESEWKPERYHDDYEKELRQRIKAKQKGSLERVVEEEESPAKVLDLMEALQASLDGGTTRKGSTKAKAKRSGTRRTASRAKATKSTSRRRPTKRATRRAS